MKNDLKHYFEEILKLNPSVCVNLGFKSKYIFTHYENTHSHDYENKFKHILNKYKNTNNISLRYIINNNLRMLKYPFNLLPLYSFENIIMTFDFENENIYPKNNLYLRNRIREFDNIITTIIERMKEGISKNITIPKIICIKLIKDLSDKEYKYRYRKLLYFLKNIYLPHCQDNIGLCNLNQGKEMYKLLIYDYCKFNVSPEYIHHYGIKEVNRLFKLLNTQKNIIKSYCKTKKEVIDLYKNKYNYIQTEIMPKNFNYIVKTKCKIMPIKKTLAKTMPNAFYDVLLHTFYININDLKSHNKDDILSLTMHESVPGHHYQFCYMVEKKFPLYKIYGIDNTAYTEGWALYSETLGHQNNGAIMSQLFRAVRLVVDTGIHYYGWSYKRAYKYMKKYISYSEKELKNELYRYICVPGQAVSYYMGKNYILKLRNLYIKVYKLGDIKDFHDFILEDGVVTFDYLMKKLIRLKNKNKNKK